MPRPLTEKEDKGGRLPAALAQAVDRYYDRLSNHLGLLAVDKDSGFATETGVAWDILLAAGWRTNDGGHRVIIESNAKDAAYLIRTAEPCDCDDCKAEMKK